MNRTAHWRGVYQSKSPREVSWYREHLTSSLAMIARSGFGAGSALVDVGAGASTLVDDLLEAGWSDLTVIEIAAEAMAATRARLGARAERVKWIEGDILHAQLQEARFDLWHDRAVFHFLIDPEDRRRYVELLEQALRPGGEAIIATFATEGPLRCSGLDVRRYDAADLAGELGEGFQQIESLVEPHETPTGAEQQFLYCRFRRLPR